MEEICGFCEDRNASYQCIECDLYFCQTCGDQKHKKKPNRLHTHIPVQGQNSASDELDVMDFLDIVINDDDDDERPPVAADDAPPKKPKKVRRDKRMSMMGTVKKKLPEVATTTTTTEEESSEDEDEDALKERIAALAAKLQAMDASTPEKRQQFIAMRKEKAKLQSKIHKQHTKSRMSIMDESDVVEKEDFSEEFLTKNIEGLAVELQTLDASSPEGRQKFVALRREKAALQALLLEKKGAHKKAHVFVPDGSSVRVHITSKLTGRKLINSLIARAAVRDKLTFDSATSGLFISHRGTGEEVFLDENAIILASISELGPLLALKQAPDGLEEGFKPSVQVAAEEAIRAAKLREEMWQQAKKEMAQALVKEKEQRDWAAMKEEMKRAREKEKADKEWEAMKRQMAEIKEKEKRDKEQSQKDEEFQRERARRRKEDEEIQRVEEEELARRQKEMDSERKQQEFEDRMEMEYQAARERERAEMRRMQEWQEEQQRMAMAEQARRAILMSGGRGPPAVSVVVPQAGLQDEVMACLEALGVSNSLNSPPLHVSTRPMSHGSVGSGSVDSTGRSPVSPGPSPVGMGSMHASGTPLGPPPGLPVASGQSVVAPTVDKIKVYVIDNDGSKRVLRINLALFLSVPELLDEICRQVNIRQDDFVFISEARNGARGPILLESPVFLLQQHCKNIHATHKDILNAV